MTSDVANDPQRADGSTGRGKGGRQSAKRMSERRRAPLPYDAFSFQSATVEKVVPETER